MADENSIYNEVKKLIVIRQANTVLQSEALIEYVYCEPNAYPLVYRRKDEDTSVLVAINPSGKDASFPYAGELGDVIYQNGGDLKVENGMMTVPAATAVFVYEN